MEPQLEGSGERARPDDALGRPGPWAGEVGGAVEGGARQTGEQDSRLGKAPSQPQPAAGGRRVGGADFDLVPETWGAWFGSREGSTLRKGLDPRAGLCLPLPPPGKTLEEAGLCLEPLRASPTGSWLEMQTLPRPRPPESKSVFSYNLLAVPSQLEFEKHCLEDPPCLASQGEGPRLRRVNLQTHWSLGLSTRKGPQPGRAATLQQGWPEGPWTPVPSHPAHQPPQGTWSPAPREAPPSSPQVPPTGRCLAHLDIFLRLRSSALAFWAEVKLSASARLSTAMARKTLSRMSGAAC